MTNRRTLNNLLVEYENRPLEDLILLKNQYEKILSSISSGVQFDENGCRDISKESLACLERIDLKNFLFEVENLIISKTFY